MIRKTVKKKRIKIIFLGMLVALLLCAFAGGASFMVKADSVTEGIFTVNQELMAKDAQREDVSFSYELTAVTDGAPLPGGASGVYRFSLSKNESRRLQIAFTNGGEYEYRLKCTGCDSGKYKIDTGEYTIKVLADSVPASVVIYNPDGTKRENADFKHVKLGVGGEPELDPIVVVDPPVRKYVKGTPNETDEFKFRLKAQETGNPMPEGSIGDEKVMSIFGEGVEDFGTWEYEKTGTYNYDISEINLADPDYRYDTKMFTITDVVTLDNGEFKVDRTITDSSGRQVAHTLVTPQYSGERPVGVEFTNEYIGDGSGQDPTEGGNTTDTSDNPGGNTPGNSGANNGDGGTDGSDGGNDSGSTGSRASKASSVFTGDAGRIIIWLVSLCSAAAVIIIIVAVRRRK